ncbi:hypothetical protein IWQ61_004619 [Dispira simplex]|nr:hypothetical protein IWQ61_004619 [Dispira simplex]
MYEVSEIPKLYIWWVKHGFSLDKLHEAIGHLKLVTKICRGVQFQYNRIQAELRTKFYIFKRRIPDQDINELMEGLKNCDQRYQWLESKFQFDHAQNSNLVNNIRTNIQSMSSLQHSEYWKYEELIANQARNLDNRVRQIDDFMNKVQVNDVVDPIHQSYIIRKAWTKHLKKYQEEMSQQDQ